MGADEIYSSINLKETKTSDMPRFSKPRSTKNGSKRRISNHQVCIVSATNEYDNAFLEIVGTSSVTSVQVKEVFKNKISKVFCLITDCKSSYESFVKENNMKSNLYDNNSGYNLSNINSIHSELSTSISCFKGVSAKHLQHYLDWFNFQKLINYTAEY